MIELITLVTRAADQYAGDINIDARVRQVRRMESGAHDLVTGGHLAGRSGGASVGGNLHQVEAAFARPDATESRRQPVSTIDVRTPVRRAGGALNALSALLTVGIQRRHRRRPHQHRLHLAVRRRLLRNILTMMSDFVSLVTEDGRGRRPSCGVRSNRTCGRNESISNARRQRFNGGGVNSVSKACMNARLPL